MSLTISMLNTPILFIVFNRPDTTRLVFETIRMVKPRQLFVAADGPRPGREEEAVLCQEVRRLATAVDWECDVKTLFRAENLGCGMGVKTAIDWFFENVDKGVILEDDCLPNISFFHFCENLLRYYFNDSAIMHISGSNFLFGNNYTNSSYYFSKYAHVWGWATWRRAWNNYRFDMIDIESHWPSICNYYRINPEEKNYWDNVFSAIVEKKIDTWDGQWLYSIWKSRGVSITPSMNLVSNIGFAINATHTFNSNSFISNIPSKRIKKILHPINIKTCQLSDDKSFKNFFLLQYNHSLMRRVFEYLKRKTLKISPYSRFYK